MRTHRRIAAAPISWGVCERAGYSRWWVLEQDTATTGPEPAVGSGPMAAVKRSLEFIETLAPTEESVAP